MVALIIAPEATISEVATPQYYTLHFKLASNKVMPPTRFNTIVDRLAFFSLHVDYI